MSTAGIILGGWLGNFLTRLAAGATPIDGLHESTVKAAVTNVPPRRRRSRHFGASPELAPAADQTQFIRGLS
jgi:hypothetical protein